MEVGSKSPILWHIMIKDIKFIFPGQVASNCVFCLTSPTWSLQQVANNHENLYSVSLISVVSVGQPAAVEVPPCIAQLQVLHNLNYFNG